ncbi:MAG: EAL domain-containing protein [Proteobacteria bacterium]|nr:EAL domain-containing protein [Pseudomonadota bacterium]
MRREPDHALLDAAALGGWAALIDALPSPVWLVDAEALRVVAANVAAALLFGMPVRELIGRPALELSASPEDAFYWAEAAEGIAEDIESDTLVRRLSGGQTLPVTRRVTRVRAGERMVYVVALVDRSEQVRIERDLEASTAELQATLESTADGILVTDLAGRIRNFNQRFAAIWGVPEDLLVRRDDDAVFDWMRRSVIDPNTYMRRLSAIDEATMLQASDVIRLHGGKVVERVTLPHCIRGRPIGRVYSFRDMTEKLEANERIETLSHTDALTGLPNRRQLGMRLDAAIHAAQRDASTFALLFLNLDHFKHVNDTLGHAFGDRVLLDVAERIQACLRQMDTVARLGGDEFVLLLDKADATSAEAVARRVSEELQRPFAQAGMTFTVTSSIGIALFPADGSSSDEVMQHADTAMHAAKSAGRAGIRFHQPGPERSGPTLRSRMQLDHAMRQALAQGRFRLNYQPKVELAGGRVVGVEALLRWRDPERGEISPGEFIPVAEESGFIVALGDWVLSTAVRQAAAWERAGQPLAVSVNVSALQFQQPGFVEHVGDAVRDAGLTPELLELELTESILIQDAAEALARLNLLAELGVRLSIDDFGTGYSSLSYLKRFPIACLKIDRSLVSGLPDDASDAGIVRAIVQMGRALNLEIVAEGVETAAQRAFLEQAGCDLFQGFLFAPALDVVALQSRLDSHRNMPHAAPRPAPPRHRVAH